MINSPKAIVEFNEVIIYTDGDEKNVFENNNKDQKDYKKKRDIEDDIRELNIMGNEDRY